MILQCAQSNAVAISASQKSEKGAFTGKFRKELIKTGKYFKAANKQEFEITPSHLSHWTGTFQRMSANGIKVSCPSTHSKAGDPSANNGWISDMFVDGNALVGIFDLTAPSEAQLETLAKNSDVSINCPEEYIDPKTKEKYTMPIDHVALCTDPVIPGLDGFYRIAASKGTSNMNWEKFQTMIGNGATITDDNAFDILSKHFGDTQAAAIADAVKKANPNPNPPMELNPVMLSLSKKNRELQLSQLVKDCKITPAVKDELTKMFCTDAALQLSAKAGSFEQFDSLCEILAKNNPVELREKSGPQGLELSQGDGKNTQTDNPLTRAADARAKAAK
jgi:hypothetical protein